MKKIYSIIYVFAVMNAFSQIYSPNGNNYLTYNGNADLNLRFAERGNGGRAISHLSGNVLGFNYNSDFTGGTKIGNDVFFKDGGNSYINSGNFGIGTANPLQKFVVSNAGAEGFEIYLGQPNGTVGLQVFNRSTLQYNKLAFSASQYIFNYGNIGIGTDNPTSQFDVVKTSATNDNEVIANFRRSVGTTGGSSIVRFGYYNTCDFEINSGYSNTGHRFGSYFDLNIVNNFTGGVNGGINFATNGSAKMAIRPNGNVGIGTTAPTSKLTVAGDIHSREVKVTVDAGADFVFAEDYALPSLNSVDKYIRENKHLPEIASAKEMMKDGINLSEMNIKLLQKIEEQTLYIIEMNKQLQVVKDQIKELKKNSSK